MCLCGEDLDFQVDLLAINEEIYEKYEQKLLEIDSKIQKLLVDSFFAQEPINSKENNPPNTEEHLKTIIERNKQLKSDLDVKLEGLKEHQKLHENNKEDAKILTQEIKETHEAFLSAKQYYKKHLNIYYTIQSSTETHQIIFLQFFTESKKDHTNYSVRFKRTIANGLYELIDMTPKINLEEMQNFLHETNDVPGLLYLIREEFLKLKQKTKDK